MDEEPRPGPHEFLKVIKSFLKGLSYFTRDALQLILWGSYLWQRGVDVPMAMKETLSCGIDYGDDDDDDDGNVDDDGVDDEVTATFLFVKQKLLL